LEPLRWPVPSAAAKGSPARWSGGVSAPEPALGKTDEAIFVREPVSVQRENNTHRFSWPVLQTRTEEEKNWNEGMGNFRAVLNWEGNGASVGVPSCRGGCVASPGPDPQRAGCCAPALRLELFPAFHHLGKICIWWWHLGHQD